jgi:AcrR family transcriptional regulator
MVMDAAVAVMARNDYAAMSVADVLAEAGVSTSSFYRHFASKEALLAALIRREAQSAQRYVESAIQSASGPVPKLEAWLEAVLDLFFQPKKAARTALFSTPQVMSSSWMATAFVEMSSYPSQPLVAVLRAGHEAEVLYSPTPEADAVSIFTVLSRAATLSRSQLRTRKAVRAHVVRFAWPALNVADQEPPTASSAPRRSGARSPKRDN